MIYFVSRFDNLQEEMKRMRPSHLHVRGHQRTGSNLSNISMESEMSVSTTVSDDVTRPNGDDVSEVSVEAQWVCIMLQSWVQFVPQDFGYGSGRRQHTPKIQAMQAHALTAHVPSEKSPAPPPPSDLSTPATSTPKPAGKVRTLLSGLNQTKLTV